MKTPIHRPSKPLHPGSAAAGRYAWILTTFLIVLAATLTVNIAGCGGHFVPGYWQPDVTHYAGQTNVGQTIERPIVTNVGPDNHP